MNVLVLVVLVIMLLSSLRGYKKGFLKTGFALISWVIVLIACNLATPMVTEFLIEKTEIDEMIQIKIDEKLSEVLLGVMEETGLSEMQGVLQEDMAFEVPKEVYEVLPEELKLLAKSAEDNIEGMESLILIDTTIVSNRVMRCVALIMVLLFSRIAILIVEIVLGFMTELPVIGVFDKLVGFVCGAGIGLVLCWAVLAVVSIMAWTGVNYEFAGYISDSEILSWMQSNNMILELMSN